MVRQRPRKTYLSAVQRAERQTQAREKEQDGETKHRRQYRRPPPRFSDLFVKKKENQDEDSSKENVIPSQAGEKVEGSFEQSQISQGFRGLLAEITATNSTATSGPSFNDTFDKVFGRTRYAAKPQVLPKNLSSSSSASHFGESGVLFNSLMSSPSSRVAEKSVERTSMVPRNNNAQAQKKKKKKDMAQCSNINKFHSKGKTKQTSKPPVYSPQLFTSTEMAVAEEDTNKVYELSNSSPQSFANDPPKAKARSLRWRTRGQQTLCKPRATKATGGTSSSSHASKNKTENNSPTAAVVPVSSTAYPQAATVQPTSLVHRFLNSQGISSSVPCLNSPKVSSSFTPSMDGNLVAPQIKKSGGPHLSGGLSSKSSIHTSTPTEQSRLVTVSRKGSRWSASASPSLEMKLSPVPREEDMVTDNSSVFVSPPILAEGNKNQLQGEAGASPTLPSKYETCTSGRRGQMNSTSSSQEFVTGEIGDKGSRSPSYYNGSARLTHGPFKGARIPTLIFCSPQQIAPSLHQDGLPQGSDSGQPLRLDTSELSPIIKIKSRTQRSVKRLEKNSHNFPSKQKTKTTKKERKTLPSWLAKRFSPTVTRGRSRLLGLLSDESQNTDRSCFQETIDESDKIAELGHSHGMNQKKRSVSRGKSRRLASQRILLTLMMTTNQLLVPFLNLKSQWLLLM